MFKPLSPTRLIGCFLILLILLLAAPGFASGQGSLAVTINEVKAEPVEGKAAYKVTSYLTVTDASGQPIAGLKPESFSAAQDGSPVTLDSAAIAQRPATIILVIDTSGSMAYENKMSAAKDAAGAFIGGLSQIDQVGIIYFSDDVTVAQNPSTDQQAGKSIVSLLDSKPNGGTCLYDAAYTGVKLATTTPPGQRAVLLLTDGIDELPGGGKPCSRHKLDEVIDLANQTGVTVPIYSIGVGDRVNQDELRKVAEGTGGGSLIAPAAGDVAGLFNTLSAQLKNQYGLVYESAAASGQHTLTVTVNAGGASGVGTRAFVAPELPPSLSLSGLDPGAILDGKRAVRATLAGKADLSKVTFSLDGAGLAEVSQPPYEVTLDGAALKPGTHRLAASAALADGTKLEATLDFATAAPQPASAPGSLASGPAGLPLNGPLPAALAAGVILLIIAAVVVIRGRRASPSALAARRSFSADAFGILTVQRSVSLQRGHVFELSGDRVRIGRGDDNDVVIPDAPVSRNHAEIRMNNATPTVFDLRSTYHTFVNNKAVDDSGLPLKDGDKLKIGTRTVLAFTAILQPEAGRADRTMDNIAETIMGVDSGGTIVAEELVPRAGPTTPAKTIPDSLKGVRDSHDEDTKPDN
jgi:VWFA-related protein